MDSVPEQPDQGHRLPLPPWDMYTVAVGLFSGYILIPLLVSNILTLTNPFIEPAYRIFVQQAITLFSWVGIFAFLSWKYRCNLAPYLGIDLSRPKAYYIREALYVMMGMLSLVLLINLWMKSLGLAPDQPYAKYTSNELQMIAVFAIITAPVIEELVFRGFVQSTFHKISPPVRTVLFTCLLFVLFHGSYFSNLQALMYVLCLGLLLGYWRERTQSIVPGILGHLFNNTLASIALFFR